MKRPLLDAVAAATNLRCRVSHDAQPQRRSSINCSDSRCACSTHGSYTASTQSDFQISDDGQLRPSQRCCDKHTSFAPRARRLVRSFPSSGKAAGRSCLQIDGRDPCLQSLALSGDRSHTARAGRDARPTRFPDGVRRERSCENCLHWRWPWATDITRQSS